MNIFSRRSLNTAEDNYQRTMAKPETTSEGWHDWVADLFEPAFGATIADLVSGEELKEPVVRHVSVYDTEAVRRVYQKVHMMTQLDEEMRRQKAQQAGVVDKSTELPTATGKPSIPSVEETAQSTTEGKVVVDLNSSCIWDSNEIAVLRQAYKSIKEANINAMVHVREVEKRNQELETLSSKQATKLKSQKDKLVEARKANSRLKIHCDTLQSELDYSLAKISAMEEIIAEIKQDKADMVQELHDNRVATDRERIERERIQLKLDTLKQEALAEKMAAEDNIRTMCKQVILDLQKQVTTLTDELKKERSVHRNTAKGLNHLRSHFASLSVEEILPAGGVRTDQIAQVDY